MTRPKAAARATGTARKDGKLLPVTAGGLCFEASGKRLVDAVDLTLEAGKLTVIMGPNGAGKSLLLRLMHGLIEPSAGAVSWGDEGNGEAVRKRQAMVFQAPVLLRRSVAANIEFVLRLRGRGGSGKSCEDILRHYGLADLASRPARLLSGGERQRLAFARALATDPEVLFLDEPTASLDPASTVAIEEMMSEAHDGGVKLILVTHDLGQARRMAGEVVFMNKGRVVEHSPAEVFFDAPKSPAARDFIAGRIVL